MDPEPVVKVELYRKNINDVTVKFRYSIRITNEGDIAGYAKEITDYVPEGLRFLAEDNPGWTDEGNNVISTTRKYLITTRRISRSRSGINMDKWRRQHGTNDKYSRNLRRLQ